MDQFEVFPHRNDLMETCIFPHAVMKKSVSCFKIMYAQQTRRTSIEIVIV